MKKFDPPRKAGETAKYEDDPFGLGDLSDVDIVVAPDSHPLAATETITIVLNRETLAYVRQKAKETGVPASQMISKVLDAYVAEERERLQSGKKR